MNAISNTASTLSTFEAPRKTRKSGNKIMENRRFLLGDGRYRGSALLRLGSQEVSVPSFQDSQGSRAIYIAMVLLSFRVEIASGSLELLVQHDMLELAES